MIAVLESNLRQQNRANAASIVLAFSMVAAVFFGENVFIGKKGPMQEMTIPFLIITIVLFVIWFIMYRRMRIQMAMTMDDKGEYYITVPLKTGETIQLNKISAIEPIFSRISVGKGPRIKDVFLKIYDESGNNSLTLCTQIGAIYEDPDEFFEMPDSVWTRYDKGTNS